MKDKKFSYPPVQIGASFMLLIFVILCMVTFAVLSLSTSMKDYEYSVKNSEKTIQYYTANNIAEEKLAEIISSETTEKTIEYQVPINDNEALEVVIMIQPDKNTKYSIVTWKQISTKEWTGDEKLPVLGG